MSRPFGWGSPPGTPTGLSTEWVETTCPECGTLVQGAETVDRSTNGAELEVTHCPDCSAELTDCEWEPSEPPEQEYEPEWEHGL